MPELRGRFRRPRRALVALCTTAVATAAGVPLAQVGHAEPEPTISEVKDQVDTLYHDAEVATERYNAATEELADVQRRVEQAQASIARQEVAVEQARASVAGFAAATYRDGGVFDSTLQAILSDDPTEFLAQVGTVDAYASQQAEQLEAVAEQSRALEQVRMLADEELARLRAIESTMEAEKASIEQKIADAQGILDQLEADELARLEEEREEAAEQPGRGDDDDNPPPPDVPASERAQVAIDFAMGQVGEPYRWGATGPSAWDCSGLTSAAWAEAGVSLPRTSSSQINVGTRVSRSQLQPGDLVFYYSPISHVGIYIGGGRIVHAPRPGASVTTDPIDLMPFAGASRPA